VVTPWQQRIAPIAVAVALLCAAAPAMAQSAAPPGASSCSGCHGPQPGAAVPSLEGLDPEAIVAAMEAFRSGQREATIMNRIAKGFSDEETRALAAWVSQKH